MSTQAIGSSHSPTTAGVTAPVRRGRRTQPWAVLFVLPTLLALGFAFIYPLISVIRSSFYAGSLAEVSFVGIDNYTALWHDPVFRTALGNNLKLLATVPVMAVISLLLSLVLADRLRGWTVYRSAIFLPYVLPAAGIGVAFSAFLTLNGTLNTVLRGVGLGALAQNWIGSPRWAIVSVAAVIIWQQLGFGVALFTAALLNLPREVTEAARLDGASWTALQTRVHIPQMRSTLEFFCVTEAITVLSWVFNYVYVLTGGGPGNASAVLELYIWRNGFAQGAVGLANAASVVVLALAVVLIVVYFRLRTREDPLREQR